jgi:hypothetical protein
VFPRANVQSRSIRIDQFPALVDIWLFRILLFGFFDYIFHSVDGLPAQEWHVELQSLKQDSSAGFPESAELH